MLKKYSNKNRQSKIHKIKKSKIMKGGGGKVSGRRSGSGSGSKSGSVSSSGSGSGSGSRSKSSKKPTTQHLIKHNSVKLDPQHLTLDALSLIFKDLNSMFKFAYSSKYYLDLISHNLIHLINSIFRQLPQTEQDFITLMKTNKNRFNQLTIYELRLLFKIFKVKFEFTGSIYSIDNDVLFNNYLFLFKQQIDINIIQKIYNMNPNMTQVKQLIEDFTKLKKIGFKDNNINIKLCELKLTNTNLNVIKDAIYFKKFYDVKEYIILIILDFEKALDNQNMLNELKQNSEYNQRAILENITKMIEYKMHHIIKINRIIYYALTNNYPEGQKKIDDALQIVEKANEEIDYLNKYTKTKFYHDDIVQIHEFVEDEITMIFN